MPIGKYEKDLDKQPANYSALTPLSFLKRSAHIFPNKTAVIDDDVTLNHRELYARCKRMASALRGLGVEPLDTVSVLLYNSHEMLESHYSIPMAGAVVNALNTRLDARGIRYIIQHAETKVLIYDSEFTDVVREAIAGLGRPITLVAVRKTAGAGQADWGDARDYEALLGAGDRDFEWSKPADEWTALSLCYTSGTTANPKGVVYHHRGAYLASIGNAMAFGMSADTNYLWTLPMFHCNGWCYTWGVTAAGGTHICLRKVRTESVLDRILKQGATHMCGAPVVLNQLIHDLSEAQVTLPEKVQFAVGGAAPPNAVIAKAGRVGMDITHLYGLTEGYGPTTVCVRQDEWQRLSNADLAAKMSRQGVGLYAMDDVQVHDAQGMPVSPDGNTLGELVHRGNTLMMGYLKNASATQEAFHDGWFHTGDIAVMHPDGYVEVKDRAKDVIISGGENISSKEVEDVLYEHPAVHEAAVVAMPDEKWGEVPCAFITLKQDAPELSSAEMIEYCRQNLPGFKVPKKVVFGELPKTSTGKIRKNVLRERF